MHCSVPGYCHRYEWAINHFKYRYATILHTLAQSSLLFVLVEYAVHWCKLLQVCHKGRRCGLEITVNTHVYKSNIHLDFLCLNTFTEYMSNIYI